MYRVIRSALSLMCVLLVTGCSAGDFNGPIVEFGKATKSAADEFDNYNATITKALVDRSTRQALAQVSATHPKEECRPTSARCTLLFRGADGSTHALGMRSADGIAQLMTAVKDYAAGLTDIVAANTGGEVDAAIANLKTSLLTLAKDGDDLNKQIRGPTVSLEGKLSRFASPVAGAAAFALNKALEAVKIAALRNATEQMEALMPELTIVFDHAARTAWTFRRNELYTNFTVALRAYNTGAKTKEKLDALENTRAAFDAILRQKDDPGAIFKALATAHTELNDAVHNPKANFESLFAAIQRVSAEAVKLAAISKEFRDAKAKKAGS